MRRCKSTKISENETNRDTEFEQELLIYFQKAGIRLDDVQYIDLFKEYRTLSAQGEKVSYIVARLATEYAISERKVYSLIRRFKTDCNLLAV